MVSEFVILDLPVAIETELAGFHCWESECVFLSRESDPFGGLFQQKYGYAKVQVGKELDEFSKALKR